MQVLGRHPWIGTKRVRAVAVCRACFAGRSFPYSGYWGVLMAWNLHLPLVGPVLGEPGMESSVVSKLLYAGHSAICV